MVIEILSQKYKCDCGRGLAKYEETDLLDKLNYLIEWDFVQYPIVKDKHIEVDIPEIDENGDIPYLYFLDGTDEKDIMVLLAGVIAEKICGYNKGRFRSDATDKARIKQITLNKRLISNLRKQTEEMLTPLKDTLYELTERTIEKYPQTRDENKEIYYCIFQTDIIKWVSELFPEALKPQKVCIIRIDNPGYKQKR